MNKFKVKYLGHSSFLVETDKCYLMFDYTGSVNEDEYEIMQADINFDDFKDKRLYMFQSHDHFDHYNKVLHEKISKYDNIVTILGDIKSKLKNTISMTAYDINDINNEIRVYAGRSTDLGVCFLIDLDGFVIFHSGDNADWGDGVPNNAIYYEEIDFFSNIDLKVDLVFIPICNFFGERPNDMTKGAIYAIEKLNPDYVFPMHGDGREQLYSDFADDAKKAGIKNKIICMKKIGDEV